MPFTVNGIGTHYYGNRNRQVRQALCRSCGREGPLASYDTRLWFVVVFIPVIPLGRKRILDECPSCRRHFVAGADEFAMGSQLAVSEAREKYHREPAVPSALEAHARMLAYHQHEDADALRKDALERFPRDAALRCSLAAHLGQMNRYAESAALYEDAWKLDEHLPDARIGAAFNRMNENRLDDARQLLDFLEKPGAGQLYALNALETLALQYQKQGRHQEAIELFRHLLNEFPDAAQNHAVRQMVRVSEKKLGARESVLPDRAGSWLSVFNPWSPQFSKAQHTWAFIMLVAVLLAAGAAANLAWLGRHRTLHILSGLDQPVTVQVDDQAPIAVASHERVVVAEGSHRVAVSGPITANYNIMMQSPFWSRMFQNPVWIVNVAGTAGLAQLQIHYAANPQPAGITFLSGQTTVALPHVDYPFVEAPKTMQLSNRQAVVTKSGLVMTPVEPRHLVSHITNPNQALDCLEAFLQTRPNDGMLFHSYQELAKKSQTVPRAEAFLKSRLDRRPVEMNWHRTYQNLLEEEGRTNELVAQYQAELDREPNNGLLIYLRARIEDDPDRAEALYEQARTAAADSPWPWYSLGFRSMSSGDWSAARDEFREAQQRGLDPEFLRGSLFTTQLALGDTETLITENRAALQREAGDVAALAMLLDALVAKGEIEAAKQELNAWRARMLPSNPEARLLGDLLEQMVNYEIGDFAAMDARLAKAPEENLQGLRVAYLLAAGHPEHLADIRGGFLDDAWDMLSVSVSYDLSGNKAEAHTWRQKACEQLGKKHGTELRASVWLTADEAPEVRQVEQAVLDPTHKLILLCAVAQKFPELLEPLKPLVKKLNVIRRPPHQLVARVFP